MKIELTAGDVQHLAGGALKKPAAAEKFARRADVVRAVTDAAKEVLEDLVFEEELDDDADDAEE